MSEATQPVHDVLAQVRREHILGDEVAIGIYWILAEERRRVMLIQMSIDGQQLPACHLVRLELILPVALHANVVEWVARVAVH